MYRSLVDASDERDWSGSARLGSTGKYAPNVESGNPAGFRKLKEQTRRGDADENQGDAASVEQPRTFSMRTRF